MKCFNHPKEDAVAVCKICGKGVCNECVMVLAGNSYCKTCVEAGRVKAPALEAPTPPTLLARPTEIPSRTLFIIGGVGAIISGISALFVLFFGGLITTWSFGGLYGRPIGLEAIGVSISALASAIMLAIGFILAGIGYFGIKRNYGAGPGTAAFAFSIFSAVSLFVNVAFGLFALSYSPYYPAYSNNPWYWMHISLAFITLILFGIMQILWGFAHLSSRPYTGSSGLAMATGIMLIISGALTVTMLIAFAGIFLFLISEMLAGILFLTSTIPRLTAQTA